MCGHMELRFWRLSVRSIGQPKTLYLFPIALENSKKNQRRRCLTHQCVFIENPLEEPCLQVSNLFISVIPETDIDLSRHAGFPLNDWLTKGNFKRDYFILLFYLGFQSCSYL